jgi:uncharacterized phiE125 gp8 family phage protein
MTYKVSVPVSAEPLALSDLKLHLKVDLTTDDLLLEDMITAARDWCEAFTGRGLARQTIILYLDEFPDEIELPFPPLSSVTSVAYKDSAGTTTTLAASAYIADTDGPIGRIVPAYGTDWPTFTEYPINPIRVTYVTGYLECPKQIVQAMLLLIGEWYAKREAGEVSPGCMNAVKYLLLPYKVRWMDG